MASKRALDLLLGRESLDRQSFGFEVARIIGAEKARGLFTYFARFDVALLIDLCWRIGASPEDERIKSMVNFVAGEQGPYGLWEYKPNPQATRWVTTRVLPLPGPARISSGPSRCATASRWASVRPSSRWSKGRFLPSAGAV